MCIRTACCIMYIFSCFVIGEARAAAFEDGNELFQNCQSDEEPEGTKQGDASRGLCLGYVLGAYDAGGKNYAICVPVGVTAAQVKDVVRHWLQSHPEKRHLPAAGLVLDALLEKFPCA